MRRSRAKSFKKFQSQKYRGPIKIDERGEIRMPPKPKEKDMRFELFNELRERLIDIESKGPDL